MAYINKPNYPSLKKPGTYPSGSVKELGLDNDDLEKFSLGSWEEASLSTHRFKLSTTYDDSFENTIEDGLEGFEKENLFGFAYVDDGNVNIKIEEVSDKLKLINYDKKQKQDEYNESSVPVKINFGMDFVPDIPVANYDQREAGQIVIDLSEDDFDTNTMEGSDRNELMGTGGDYWSAVPTTGTVWGDLTDGWAIGYLNYKNPGDVVPEPIEAIVLNHEITPFVIKWNTFGNPADGDGPNRYLLPNGAYRIEFTTAISKTDFPIKILDRVKLFSYWDHEYNVIDILGTLTHIEAIQLDVVYPGDISADAFAQANATLGYLAGEDWLDWNVATNKVMYLPAPFELRQSTGQDSTEFESVHLGYNNLAEAYTWGNQNSEVNHRAASQHGGIPVLRSEDMPPDYEIVISRPKSSAAESNLDFNRLYFQDDDIRTFSGDELISLFKESIPRSPRQLSQDISPQLLSKQYSDGSTDSEIIGFRDPNNSWNNDSYYGLAVSNEPIATNVTMRARHGYYNSGLPPSANNNSNAGGKQWSGNLDDNVNDRFPITTDRFPAYIEGLPAANTKKYPSLHLSKDSEYVIYPAPSLAGDEATVEFVFEPDILYRLKFNVRYARQAEPDNDNYNVKIGIGILDKSIDVDTSGTEYYIKALTSTHKETDLVEEFGAITRTTTAAPVMHEQTLYSEIFKNSLPVNTLKGKPYITINVKLDNGGSFPSDLTHRIFFQVTDYQIEEVTVDTTDPEGEGAAFMESLDISNSYLYKYKVLQWGDEKQKLTNEQILNTFYLSWYNTELVSDWVLKQYDREVKSTENFIKNSDSNLNLTSHVYNTSGLKSIKTIVYRINQTQTNVLETKLITTNILINDGNLTSQDFSIFGGTDFNFLPLSNTEAIIGGLDEDSKYNNSVEKIKKDDNFIEEDYLERASSRDFIDNFNKKLYGESPGQLDLSTTRMYKKPFDIYDFITDDKQSIVDNNFNINTLPINSSATDIFISNNDCIVDLNPQDVEYLSIQNKTGTADKAILIGDYKVNQPKDGKIQRQGVMETPLLEQNTDKQAF